MKQSSSSSSEEESLQNEKPTDIDEIVAMTESVFGDSHLAESWLNKSNVIFMGKSPIQQLEKAGGKSEVLKALNAIAYGGVV